MSHLSKRSLLTGAFFLSLMLPSPVYAVKSSAPAAVENWTGMIMAALVFSSAVGGIAYGLGHRQGRSQSLNADLDENVNGDLDREVRLPSPKLPVPVSCDSTELDLHEHSDLSKVSSASSSEASILDTTRLAKIDIVAELIQELQSPDPGKRRKAIWDLGQHGDSRALLPMVDLMRDSDSSQRSLILAAISEIGMKTLKPVSQALVLSLQDGSPDVRKNGIRDVTRIYDSVGQISQFLQHGASDLDQEVQETAIWALMQINRVHSLSKVEGLPRLSSEVSLKELGVGKKIQG